jgi:hypothetical protein
MKTFANVNKYFSIEKNRVRVVDKSNPILSERKIFVHFAPICTGFKLVVYNYYVFALF